jgi:hypothetical protein
MFVPVDGCQGKTWLSHANAQSRGDGELAIREHLWWNFKDAFDLGSFDASH